MKIVILNECFFKDEHLTRLKQLGDLTVYNDTDSEEKAIERVKDAAIVVANPFITPLNKKVLESSTNLKLIAASVIGIDPIDMETATQKAIKVANIPGFSTEGVAEHAIALMLAVFRKIPLSDNRMRQLPFQIDPGKEDHRVFLGMEAKGKTLGVIGLGKIGQRVAELGLAIGMTVLGFNRTPKDIPGIEMVSKEDLLKRSDVVSLNLAFAPELEKLISSNELFLMKPSSVLINTARGKHVNENALYEALKNKKIAGAGLDVLANWSTENPLLTLENVVFTPHSGFFTEESLVNMAEMVVENIESFVKGQPQNIVN